jgi:hypothetical protein
VTFTSFHIAGTSTDNLARLTGRERKAAIEINVRIADNRAVSVGVKPNSDFSMKMSDGN